MGVNYGLDLLLSNFFIFISSFFNFIYILLLITLTSLAFRIIKENCYYKLKFKDLQ